MFKDTTDHKRSAKALPEREEHLRLAVEAAEKALRDVSGKLINAQEDERRRVARELHDDIGQELVLLSIRARRIDAEIPELDEKTHAEIHELCRKITDIASKVSNLSHVLHSSELEFLGLNVATERLCRDVAKQSGIQIDYLSRELPSTIASGIALCFFRITQEALQNVVKHSKASHVVVRLQGKPEGLTLEIHDDGTGFDAERAQTGPGLGVIGMRERMNLVGGMLTICSSAGDGATVYAQVDLKRAA